MRRLSRRTFGSTTPRLWWSLGTPYRYTARCGRRKGRLCGLKYWWNCDDPNNIVIETPEGGTTYLDFDFTDVDDVPE